MRRLYTTTNPGDDNYYYYDDAFDSSDSPRIKVAFEDLSRGNDGQIFMLKNGSSTIISYEPNAFWEADDDVVLGYAAGSVNNAQAHLSFADGRVNICYGTGNIPDGIQILAGLNGGGTEDDIYEGESGLAPLPGDPFDATGIGATDWPTVNSCYCFSPSTKAWTSFVP